MSKEELKELLVKEAWEGQKNSYSPYSKFPVGAAVMGARRNGLPRLQH